MTSETPKERARRFHALHAGPRLLVLANAWDAASARIFEVAGFAAIGTTSAGVAWSHGHPDGQKIPVERMVEAVHRIASAVDVPVTADVERGFGADPEAVERTIERVIEAGAVGINLEDRSDDATSPLASPAAMAAKIRGARRAAERAGVPLFVNARTDVYFLGIADRAARVRDAKERFRAYEEAGADGLFAPGLCAPDEIAEILAGIRKPLNVYALPSLAPAAELEKLGVRRVSVGCGPMQSVLARLRKIAIDLHDTRAWSGFTGDWMSPGELNALFTSRGS